MTAPNVPAALRLAPAGLVYLLITSIGWGLTWPVMKHLLGEWPPLSARGWTGTAGAALLALLALASRQSLIVPRVQWGRLVLSALLNVTSWLTLIGLALLWLPASEAAVIAATMPVWAALLAWPILGERPTLKRSLALLLAFGGIAALMGGNGLAASLSKLPGIVLALAGAFGFALGTVTAKRFPVKLPPLTSASWQILVGCVPVVIGGVVFEHPDPQVLSAVGWSSMAYMTVVQFCISYACWFAALARLPASVAAIGTLLVPVIGVVASAIVLHEPLGPGQITALVMTLAGVLLATRS